MDLLGNGLAMDWQWIFGNGHAVEVTTGTA
jgi:hypothetical protein